MDKETAAIFRLQQASEMSQHLYHKPLTVTYSGGKDSDVLLHLADVAGIDYEVRHNLTTVDAPQTVQHIKRVFHRLQDDGINCILNAHKKPEGGGSYDVEYYCSPRVSPAADVKILLYGIKRDKRKRNLCGFRCASSRKRTKKFKVNI